MMSLWIIIPISGNDIRKLTFSIKNLKYALSKNDFPFLNIFFQNKEPLEMVLNMYCVNNQQTFFHQKCIF